jgi:GNAT superfamily N-acetyltransferase
VSFTAHIVVAADVDQDWLGRQLGPWQLSEAFLPPFLGALSTRLGCRVNAIDMVTLAPPAAGTPALALQQEDQDHPRVRRARRYRDGVAVWVTDGGLLTVGRGLSGRWEVGLEVAATHRGRGLGRALASAARHLTPDGRPVWAQIAPGNAASVRAFLAAGYRPVGMEALLVSHAHGPES